MSARYITAAVVEGFEIIPYPYLCNVTDLPEEVGESYKGTTLFTKLDNGYKENYDESLKLLEEFFPKDKIIFIMCGGGGYLETGMACYTERRELPRIPRPRPCTRGVFRPGRTRRIRICKSKPDIGFCN